MQGAYGDAGACLQGKVGASRLLQLLLWESAIFQNSLTREIVAYDLD